MGIFFKMRGEFGMKVKWFRKQKIKSPINDKQQQKNQQQGNEQQSSIQNLLLQLKDSSDFLSYEYSGKSAHYIISYFTTMVESKVLHRDILPQLTKEFSSLNELKDALPIENVIQTSDMKQIKDSLITGFVFIQIKQNDEQGLLVSATSTKGRQVSPPEIEVSVVGPKEAFIEKIDTNINLIRKRILNPKLEAKEFTVGTVSKTKVVMMYLDGIADKENINTMTQRIQNIDVDQIIDVSYITQIISDNQSSLFPQFIDSERPDRIAAVLGEGKIVVLVDGSPHVLIAPTTLVEFFSSFEDYFLNPIISSTFRLIRLFSVLFSILITPIYVGVLTHHFELIPTALLATLVTSRSQVPLPPFLEALILELTIELLREAGARLPTKVGQTIGIVGGIVIGTASVEAGLTSNVLLIFVALAALASFTTPVYQMGNTIRLIRFPFLLLAHIWGLVGIVLGFCYLLTHLLRLTSLGRPYLEPIFPPRFTDLKDSFIRLPIAMQAKRPIQLHTIKKMKFNKQQAKQKHDIDE